MSSGERRGWDLDPRVALAGLAVVTLAGLAFRAIAAQQSLYGDELYTYAVVTRSGISDLFDGIHMTENTPPLFYLLSWLTGKLGDPETWIRYPSVVLGTLAIPAVYALGARVSTRAVALLAAVLIALAPTAIFYGSEARAYAELTLFLPLSTLALLRATDGAGARWWVLYWLASAAAVYSHYSVAFVLVAQAGWALFFHRSHWRGLALANLGVVIAYLPWLPHLERNPHIFFVAQNHPVTRSEVAETLGEVFPGRNLLSLVEVPGVVALVLLGVAAAVLLGGLLASRLGDRRESSVHRPSEMLLLAALAIATPVGIIAYSLLESSLLAPRNLIASLPYALLLAACVVAVVRRPLGLAAAALCVAALVVGAVRAVDDENRRPAFNEAADLIADRAEADDAIVQFPTFPVKESDLFPSLADHPLRQDLAIYLPEDERQRLSKTGGAGWPEAETVFYVAPDLPTINELIAQAARSNGARLVERTALPGLHAVTVSEYRADGRAQDPAGS